MSKLLTLDPALITQLVVAIVTMLVAGASWATSWFNRKKLEENTALTQKAVDNHAETMDKLQTLGTKVVNVVETPKDEPPHA